MSLKGNLAKAGLVGATGAVLSVLALGGLQGVPVMGVFMPKAFVHGLALAGSSVAATYAVPMLVPFVSAGSPQLRRFEALVLEPLVIGGVFLGVESILAPAAEVQGPGGTFKEILAGSAAAIGAAYVAEGMQWVPTVLG